MRALTAVVALALLAAAAPPPSAADELLEAARRERQRREALRKQRGEKVSEKGVVSTAPVLSNGDLRRVAATVSIVGAGNPNRPTTDGTPVAAAETAADATSSDATEALTPEDGEAYWRERQDNARARAAEVRKELEELNIQINDLRRQATSIDDPNVRYQKTQELYAAEARVPELQKEIRAADAAIAAIREEGRKAGAPAGWFR